VTPHVSSCAKAFFPSAAGVYERLPSSPRSRKGSHRTRACYFFFSKMGKERCVPPFEISDGKRTPPSPPIPCGGGGGAPSLRGLIFLSFWGSGPREYRWSKGSKRRFLAFLFFSPSSLPHGQHIGSLPSFFRELCSLRIGDGFLLSIFWSLLHLAVGFNLLQEEEASQAFYRSMCFPFHCLPP